MRPLATPPSWVNFRGPLFTYPKLKWPLENWVGQSRQNAVNPFPQTTAEYN
jgi:hypothetical protein